MELPKREFEIIELISQNEGSIFAKEVLCEKLRYLEEGNNNVIKEHVRWIRNKLDKFGEKIIFQQLGEWGINGFYRCFDVVKS